MNYCNFAKVFQARTSKDKNVLDWFKNDGKTDCPTTPKYVTNLSDQQRFENYISLTSKFPKLHMPYSTFRLNLRRVQDLVTNKKFFINHNKNKERETFNKHFSFATWKNLSENEKKSHELSNCHPCATVHSGFSVLHSSASTQQREINEACENLATTIISAQFQKSKSPNSQSKGIKIIKNVVDCVQPIIENKMGISFSSNLSDNISQGIVSPTQMRKSVEKTVKKSNRTIENLMIDNDTDAMNFLASGLSYSMYDRERMNKTHITKEAAEQNLISKLKKEKSKSLKPKDHYGKFESYDFDKDTFLAEIKQYPAGKPINWTRLARKYNLTHHGTEPKNSGQILMNFAKHHGINTNKFNVSLRVSGRDYTRRVRRSKMKLGKSRISVPSVRSARKIKNIVKGKLQQKQLYLGESIAPKVHITNKIDKDGKLTTSECLIYGRKMPMKMIINEEMERFSNAGVLKADPTSEEEARIILRKIQEDCNTPEPLEQLKKIQNTFNMKLWHDHSDILNSSYVNFMMSFLYDTSNFLSDEEYKIKFPEKTPLDVQSFVEKPKLYIFGKSGSSDKEQLVYTDTRLHDLQFIQNGGIPKVQLRVFTGDNPARQFEAGQQRGGHYSCVCGVKVMEHQNLVHCYRHQSLTLEERRQLVTKGELWKKIEEGETNPFQKLRKEELILELESHQIWTDKERKAELSDILTAKLHGVCRPAALMCQNPLKSATENHLEAYEVLCCEPLHDITNVVQNIITELPFQVPKDMQKEFELFSNTTIGDKNQIKGSDARLYAVKLAKFISTKYENNKIDEKFLSLANSLVEIIQICYSNFNTRNQRQILRLYNQCFTFATLSRNIFAKPSKVTSRKFFGSHFHSMSVHLPETYRLFCLKSIIPEQEERSFGDLRRISLQTTNRQAKYVVDNAVLRFTVQQKLSSKPDTIKKQDSIISQQAKLLDKPGNSKFTDNFIQKNPLLFQAHLERIADFMLVGADVWWSKSEEGVEFFDGLDEPCTREEGPEIHHFRSSDYF